MYSMQTSTKLCNKLDRFSLNDSEMMKLENIIDLWKLRTEDDSHRWFKIIIGNEKLSYSKLYDHSDIFQVKKVKKVSLTKDTQP